MGTRGVCGFRYKNKDYLAYNHYDSYPSELGKNLIEEIKQVQSLHKINWDIIKDNVGKIKLIEETDEAYNELRDEQGSLIKYMLGTLNKMIDYNRFIKDSLFCEWGYIINLDTMKFEVWQGFQRVPDESNRYGTKNNEDYYPCKLILEFELNSISSEVLEVMEALEE